MLRVWVRVGPSGLSAWVRSRRCFICRQSRQQLEEEQKKALYGLESAGEGRRHPWALERGPF